MVSRRRAKGEAKFLPGAVNHNQMLPAPTHRSVSFRADEIDSRQSLGRPLVPKANIKRPGTHENGRPNSASCHWSWDLAAEGHRAYAAVRIGDSKRKSRLVEIGTFRSNISAH